MQEVLVRLTLNLEDNIASVYRNMSGKMRVRFFEAVLNHLNGNTPQESEANMYRFLSQILVGGNTFTTEPHTNIQVTKPEKNNLDKLYTELQSAGKQFLKSEDW